LRNQNAWAKDQIVWGKGQTLSKNWYLGQTKVFVENRNFEKTENFL